jgi:hypothetical protein
MRQIRQEVGLTAPGVMGLPPPLGKLWVGEFRAETSPAWCWRGPSASSDCCLQQYQSKVEFGFVLPKTCLGQSTRTSGERIYHRLASDVSAILLEGLKVLARLSSLRRQAVRGICRRTRAPVPLRPLVPTARGVPEPAVVESLRIFRIELDHPDPSHRMARS